MLNADHFQENKQIQFTAQYIKVYIYIIITIQLKKISVVSLKSLAALSELQNKGELKHSPVHKLTDFKTADGSSIISLYSKMYSTKPPVSKERALRQIK